MNVLAACERSGRVRDAFRALGHDAMSADLEPTDVDGPHHQGDVTPLLRKRWDVVIAFPPCTDLALVQKPVGLLPKIADGRSFRAAEFFMNCFDANAPRVAVENPVGLMTHYWRRPDQYIQPWMWGDPYTKRTGLWLRGLPPLLPDCSGSVGHTSWHHRFENGDKKLRGALSAATFLGVARAMAAQWGVAA